MSTSGMDPINKPQLHHIPSICLKPTFKITLYYSMWIFLGPKSRTPCLLIPIRVNRAQSMKRLSGSHHCSHSQSSTMQAWSPSKRFAYIGGKAIFMQNPPTPAIPTSGKFWIHMYVRFNALYPQLCLLQAVAMLIQEKEYVTLKSLCTFWNALSCGTLLSEYHWLYSITTTQPLSSQKPQIKCMSAYFSLVNTTGSSKNNYVPKSTTMTAKIYKQTQNWMVSDVTLLH